MYIMVLNISDIICIVQRGNALHEECIALSNSKKIHKN